MYVVIVIGALVIGGAIFGLAHIGLASQSDSGNGEQIEQSVSLEDLRGDQRFSNALFELIPGATLVQAPVTATDNFPSGKRLDVRMGIRNLHETLSLNYSFLEFSVVGFDADGREVPATVYLPPWGGYGRDDYALRPGGDVTGTFVVVHDEGMESFAVTVAYNEPGRAVETASVVWPQGR